MEIEKINLMQSTASKLLSGSALRVINHFAQIVVSLFLMPFVIFSLGDRMYGFWTVVGTIIGYYGMLDLGLSSAVNRHVSGAIGSGDEGECNRIFNTSIFLYSMLGFIALFISIILAISAPLIFKKPDDAELFWKVILVLGLNMAIGFPLRVYIGMLTAQLRFDIISAIQIFTLILRTSLVVTALILGYKVLSLACVTLLADIPGYILYIYFAKKNIQFLHFNLKKIQRKTAKILFSYSSFTFIAQLADILRFRIDFIVISAFISLSAVTHYKVGSFMVTHFIALIIACMGVLQPVFSRLEGSKDYESIKKTFFFASRISVCITSFVGFGLIVWGKPFIHRWMGPEYLDAYPVLVILVLGCVIALWQNPSVALLYGISKHSFYALFNTLEGVSNLILSLILVRYFGLVGVALGTFIPMVIIKLIIQPVYVCRVSSIDYFEYIQKMTRTISIVFLSLVIPTLLSIYVVKPDYKSLFVAGFVSLCIYLISIWVFEFNAAETEIIRGMIMPKQLMKKI